MNDGPHPEVELVPGLFLRVDAVGFGPADSADVGLMALFEIDELQTKKQQHGGITEEASSSGWDEKDVSYLVSHLWDKGRSAWDSLHDP